MRRSQHDCHFLRRAQYLVMLGTLTSVALRIVDDDSCVKRSTHECHVSRPAQHLVTQKIDIQGSCTTSMVLGSNARVKHRMYAP